MIALDYIGFLGPVILISISYAYMFFYEFHQKILFTEIILINILLNFFLKRIFRQPRPKKQLEISIPFLDGFIFKDFGMPSGHAQIAAFVTTFFLLYAKQYKYIIGTIFIAITISTLYQRYKYRAHSIFQIIIGAIIGVLMGLTNFYFEIVKINL